MIYDSNITTVNESEFMTLLENAEDRFEHYTIAEATAIIVGENETNWTNFMKAVGISELATIMEGQEVIYEGARLEGFIKKAKGWFQIALNKLAEITKSFITRINQFLTSNDAFLKKYEKELRGMSVPSDFEFKGYEFDHMKVPTYDNGAKKEVKLDGSNLGSILANRDSDYSKESAENAVFNGTPSGNSMSEKLRNYFYKNKEKEDISGKINIGHQIDILKNTKTLRKEAKDSYTKAAKEIKDIIKSLDKAEKEFRRDNKEEAKQAARIDTAFNVLLSYWKAYASAASQMHGAYLGALGSRNSQAKAICTKLLVASNKSKGKEKRKDIKAKMEGFVNTDAFLGAVEFI